jgi:hypothetical protein
MHASATMVGTYIIARSGPADSHLLADFHVRRDVLENDIIVARSCIAEGAEACDQDGGDIELHCGGSSRCRGQCEVVAIGDRAE